MTNEKKQELDALCLKFRRTLIEILHERQTGHPGGSLSVLLLQPDPAQVKPPFFYRIHPCARL